MQKKGQVSTYVIIGILVVVLLVGWYYLKGDSMESRLSPKDLPFASEAESVHVLVDQCVEAELEKALLALGFQGGHIAYPDPGYEYRRDLFIGYGLYEDENILPSRQDVSLEISEFLNFDLRNCVDFSDSGFVVEQDQLATSRVNIEDERVSVELNWPLTLTKEDKTARYDELYAVSIDVPLGRLLDVSNDIVDYMSEHDGYVNINYLEDTGLETDLLKVDDDNGLIKLTTPGIMLGGELYSFQFMNKVVL